MVPLAAQQRLFAGKSVVQLRSCCGVLLPNVLFADKRAPGRMIRVGFDCWLGNAHKSPPRPTCGPWIVDGRKDPAILLLGPNALSASADSNLRSFPSAVEDNVEECDMRAYAFGLASGPCGPNSSIQTRIKQRSAIVLQVPTPHIARHWQAAACPRAARKSATYRSPWSPHRQLCCHRQANPQSK
jgi:hypothetical protein